MKNFIFIILALISLGINAQDKIDWLSFEEAMEKNEKEPKPILIDIYTDWCGWCKRMDNTTYKNEVIIKYINENYYPVKLNGEDRNDISFEGKTFAYKSQGRRGYHELAAALMKGRLSYPSTAFLNKDKQLLQNVPGYMAEKKFEIVLAFFNDDNYKKTKWKDFEKNFKSSI
ncbi:thioredoxin family protein [Tenacibaculum sp. C7A-26P2]|uniref:thioredoxin family protein n=1 Tax=Tenacibaculum sp. C7A-26P2 TaxID=3447504 RepID=UPI003F827193